MSLVYVFAASSMEGQPVEQITGLPGNGTPGDLAHSLYGVNDFVLITGGMGPKAARAKATTALGSSPLTDVTNSQRNRKPDAVLVVGLCGSLSSSLPEARIVTYTDCLSTQPDQIPFRCSQPITERLHALLVSRGVRCNRVVGVTSSRVAVTNEDKRALAACGASAVDMESYEIVAAATQAGVPTAVLRVVSDSLDRKMPDFNRALNEDGGLDSRKFLKVAIGSPLLMARLLLVNKRAMRELVKALEIVLPADCFSQSDSLT